MTRTAIRSQYATEKIIEAAAQFPSWLGLLALSAIGASATYSDVAPRTRLPIAKA